MDFFFFKQKTAYEMRISDWSSDVCSSDLQLPCGLAAARAAAGLLMPDVEHGVVAVRQQLLLAGGAAAEQGGRQQHGGRVNPDPRHGILRCGGGPDAHWRRSRCGAAAPDARPPWRRASRRPPRRTDRTAAVVGKSGTGRGGP